MQERYSLSLYSTLLIIGLLLGIVFGVLSGCTGKSKQPNASNQGADTKRNIAELPKIGDIVTTERGLELCEHYRRVSITLQTELKTIRIISKNGNLTDVQ